MFNVPKRLGEPDRVLQLSQARCVQQLVALLALTDTGAMVNEATLDQVHNDVSAVMHEHFASPDDVVNAFELLAPNTD